MEEEYILEMHGIVKEFPGVRALKGVDFNLKPGEVHTIMGENGAGKSTLIKILTGVYEKDGGNIVFNGREVHFHNTFDAQKTGISTVYQELNMIPYLSVGENIYLGRYPRTKAGIDWKSLHKNAQKLLDDLGLDIESRLPLNQYGTASQQMVSIVRAVSLNCQVVVLDEPTSSLDSKEVRMLFNIIKQLKEKKLGIVFISHRLNEVYEISDRITILKDGAYEGTYFPEQLTEFQLIEKMVGRDVREIKGNNRVYDGNGEPFIVMLKDIVRHPKLSGVSIDVKKGEIVGLTGLLDSGRTETAKVLFGYDIPDSGEIVIDEKRVVLKAPKDGLKNGLAFVTENRREEGVIPNMTVRENISISSLPQICRRGFINRKRQEALAEEYIRRFKIKTPSMEQQLKNLSGGNQQKVLLARWIATKPKLIILDEPTRGIDVGAKKEVEDLIKEIADTGISVLLISSELSELVRGCDRIFVLRDGTVRGMLNRDEISEENIMKWIANSPA